MSSDELTPAPRPRPMKKRARKANPEARRKLLDAGRARILDEGVASLRVEDVARDAGVSVGTFYIYFKGKDDLFAQLVVEQTGALRARMQAAYAAGGPFVDRIARGMTAYIDFVEEHEKGFLHFLDVGSIQTNAGRLSTWVMEQHAKDLVPILEEGMKAGIFRQEPSNVLAHSLLGLIQHSAGWWLENREQMSRADFERFLLELTGRGVLR